MTEVLTRFSLYMIILANCCTVYCALCRVMKLQKDKKELSSRISRNMQMMADEDDLIEIVSLI